jgi:CheY-like chemotaxis protein
MLARIIGEDVELETRLQDSIGSIRIDPLQFEQIVLGLVINARDAMPGGGRLTIETREVLVGRTSQKLPAGVPPGRFALLRIRDTGRGMSEEIRTSLFEPSFSTKDPGESTGLDLHTANDVVRRAGGFIEVWSREGRGSRFTLYLPVDSENKEDGRTSAQVVRIRSRATLLLVEDEDEVRGPVREVLEQRGYRVHEAADGKTAERIAAEQPGRIDLIITDVVMPGMSGVQLVSNMLRSHPHLRALYISGYTNEPLVGLHKLGSGIDFLRKPFSPEILVRKVEELLESSTAA